MLKNSPKILVLADWFVPGYKAGGPIRSVLHFTREMQADYQVYVLTSDRDLGSREPYAGITVNSWLPFDDQVKVQYLSPDRLSWRQLLKEIRSLQPDFIYLNSMFSLPFSIYPLLQKRLGLYRARLVLAPRGMLKESALRFKSSKKKIFLRLWRLLGIARQLRFHATDEREWKDIQKHFGQQAEGLIAGNFPARVGPYPGSRPKLPGNLSLLFVGRLHPIKNLDFLLRLLPSVQGSISLTIVGNMEEEDYARQCKDMTLGWPDRLQVSFAGEIPPGELPTLLRQQHFFILPTRGENFGHAIFEALQEGRPVIISDQTPWKNLLKSSAGWDLPLSDEKAWVAALQQAADADQATYDQWSQGAWQRAHDFVQESDLKQAYHKLFS